MNNLLDYFKNINSIEDPELKLTVEILKQRSGATIGEDAAWYWENKREVKLPTSNISSLEPLQYLTQATEMVLFGNRISDISPLVNLSNLKHLNLIDNNMVFLNGINQLKVLELYLGDNLITDIKPLSNMGSLKVLGLKNNQIRDIKPLESLVYLTQLNLSGNPLDKSQVNSLRGKLPGCKILFD